MGMTISEKILARAAGLNQVKPGENVTASIDLAMAHEAMRGVWPILKEVGVSRVWDPDRVVNVFDHFVPAPTVDAAEHHKKLREVVRELGFKHILGENAGVCHQVLPERGFIKPGMLIVGTDSHTTTYGAFGAASTGIGVTEMAYVMATGKLWFRVPETILLVLTGTMGPGVTSKDLLLHIAGRHGSDMAQYKAIEFSGPLAHQLSVAQRMTMSNMSVELGAKFGIFAPDDGTMEYLKGRVKGDMEPLVADEDAEYTSRIELDATGLEPAVAFPHNVDNVYPISQAGEVSIHQGVIASCTNARLEDLHMAARVLRGRKIHRDVRLHVVPASWEIYGKALEDGTLATLVDSGSIVGAASCGPCFGLHGGLLAAGERCISSTNRNFQGRMGSPESEVYLASPATVAASCIEGRIADPRPYLEQGEEP